MGFRSNAFATVWQVESKTPTLTSVRLSTSRKDKNTGQYDTDFSGFVSFVGNIAASNAAKLKERDRIKLGDVDVCTKYDQAKNMTYTNYKCFSFENVDANMQSPQNVDDLGFMKVPEGNEEEGLPF